MAQKKQNTLVLFPDIISVTQKFTDEQFGILMRAVFSYRFYGEVYSGDDTAVDVAFQIVSNQVDRYEEYRATMANNAKRSKEEQNPAEGEQNPAEGEQKHPPYPNPYPNPYPEKVNKTDKIPNRTCFIPPTVDEVREYCQENGYQIKPEQFVDYYTAIGWMAGKNKMKDWKAAVRNWNRREQEKTPPADKKKPTLHDLFPPVPTI